MENNTVEMKKLVGTGRSGDFVLESQGTAEKDGFKNVSQFWFPQTISFEDAINNLEKERQNRQDITDKWSNWKFVPKDNTVALKNGDGQVFLPTEYALMCALKFSGVSQTHIKQTLDPTFEADEMDIQQLVDTLNYRKDRYHQTNKNEVRELLFRTYADNTLRAVLTTGFAPIDNRWFLEMLSDLVPDGRISHQRGNADTMFGNILLPDNIREEDDSGYGGMLAFRNSEIGQASLDTMPSLFRAICRNGCIWDQEKGINFRQVHKGEIQLDGLAVRIGENLTKQIAIIPEVMERFMKLRQYEFAPELTLGVFAAVAERFKLTPKQGNDMVNEFVKHEGTSVSAFGIVNSVTRTGQLYEAQITENFDKIGGELISADWNKLVNTAKNYSDKDIARVLNLSVSA